MSSDLFSFYKEELAGEKANFVNERARVTGKDVYSVLFELADEVVALVKKIRELLGDDKTKDTFEQFIVQYAAFHMYTPRYRLGEVFGRELGL